MKKAELNSAKNGQTPRARLDEGALRQLVGYQLAQASIVTNGAFSHEAGKPMELGQVEFTLLYLIKQNTSVTASRLARALAVSMPAITVWMAKLELRGLVSRERSATDRRSQHFEVTTEGAALVERAMKALLEAEARAFGHLSAAEQAMLLELLHKVAQHRVA
jgi:DNA-binding MarR family transcriptional regulator